MGTMSRMALTLVIIAALLGCTASLRMGREEAPSALPKDGVSQDASCTLYIRRPYDPIPPLPSLAGKTLTPAELNMVQAAYIRDLRQFIIQSRAKQDDAYNAYIDRCINKNVEKPPANK